MLTERLVFRRIRLSLAVFVSRVVDMLVSFRFESHPFGCFQGSYSGGRSNDRPQSIKHSTE